MKQDYGVEITHSEADAHFKTFIKIKKRVEIDLVKALYGDDEAIRYYCGRPGHFPVDEDLCFVFDSKAIVRILDMIRPSTGEPLADGIAVFNGVRDKEDESDIDGRPTLMVFPYKYSDRDDIDHSPLELFLDKGTEHPGTASKNDPLRDIYAIPAEFDPTDIKPFPLRPASKINSKNNGVKVI